MKTQSCNLVGLTPFWAIKPLGGLPPKELNECLFLSMANFTQLTLRLQDETEKKFPPIMGIETRSRFIIFTLRLRDENENSLDLILFFETIPRILKVAIFP